MNDLRTAAQQALEAMRRAVPTGKITLYEWDKALSDLADALARIEWVEPLAKQAEPLEPVAWMHNILEDNIIRHRPADLKRSPQNWTPLYNCAQPRQTDPQIEDRLARHGIPKP